MNSDCPSDPGYPRPSETNKHNATLDIYETLSGKKKKEELGAHKASPRCPHTLFRAECAQLAGLFIGS
jgi:hypothetical protein